MGYVVLSSAMACKAFRMVLLCDTIMDPLNTLEIREMLDWEPADGHLLHELERQTQWRCLFVLGVAVVLLLKRSLAWIADQKYLSEVLPRLL